jgi:hypothetical protein
MHPVTGNNKGQVADGFKCGLVDVDAPSGVAKALLSGTASPLTATRWVGPSRITRRICWRQGVSRA